MSRIIISVLICHAVLCVLPPSAQSRPKTLVQWDFDSSDDMRGWAANSSVQELYVTNGHLTGRTIGQDPAIISPQFKIRAFANQFVEIKMRSGKGIGELFWTNTTAEPYGGFRPEWHKSVEYEEGGDRVYRIFPFWQALEQVIRLRLDPPANTEFAVDYIKVCELELEQAKESFFDFRRSNCGWVMPDGQLPLQASEGIILAGVSDVQIVSPSLNLQAESCPWVSVCVATRSANEAILKWVTESLPGIQSIRIPLRQDGKAHTYNVSMEDVPEWIGEIGMMALTVNNKNGEASKIVFLGVGNKPRGASEIAVARFGLKNTVNRVGKIVSLEAVIKNVGGEPTRPLQLRLTLSPGVSYQGSATQTVRRLEPGESIVVAWQVKANRYGTSTAKLEIEGAGAGKVTAVSPLRFDQPLDTKPMSYVPEPQPVRGDFEVGVYYFPGWSTYARWSVLNDFPERKPVLGYYREGEPEVADWHIKWMVEHGITFIIYDWYWSAGSRMLEHALHKGYFNARYHEKIKFCLLWANHNPPRTSSAEDMRNVTKYWLDNYFLRPDYYKVDGKPVVVVFSPQRLTEDMGVEGVRNAFNESRKMAKERGLAGVYFVACVYPDVKRISLCEQEGYDALSGYNYPNAGDKGQMHAPYADMVSGYQEFWDTIADSSRLPYIPVVEPGWDSRPWHGVNARVRTGKTPELFQKMLENAKAFVEKRNPAAKPKMVFIEAWNEFGEGDYIEPHREFGFAYLDAIRAVFTSAAPRHVDITPMDVGLGPYELEKPPIVTSWTFDTDSSQLWDCTQGLANAHIENGCMIAFSTSNDPAFYSPPVEIDSKKFKSMEIRMRIDKGREGQLFWSWPGRGMTEAASTRFKLVPGEFHTYRLNLDSCPAWKSRITSIRLDPTDADGAKVEIDYIRFVPKKD